MAILLQGVPIDNYVGLKVKGARIEGSFTGLEIKEYVKVIDHLEKKGIIDHKQAMMFKALITQGCADMKRQTPIRLLLREVLVAYMETPDFQAKLKSPKGENDPLVRATVTLATELADRDIVLGISRKTGEKRATTAEDPGPFPVSKNTERLAERVYDTTDYDGSANRAIGITDAARCIIKPITEEGTAKLIPREKIPAADFAKVKDLFIHADDPREILLEFKPGLTRETIEMLDIPPKTKKLIMETYDKAFPSQVDTSEASSGGNEYGNYSSDPPVAPDLRKIELDPRYY